MQNRVSTPKANLLGAEIKTNKPKVWNGQEKKLQKRTLQREQSNVYGLKNDNINPV